MRWVEREKTVVIVVFLLVAPTIYFYIKLISVVWNFSTLTTVTGLPLAADFANYWSASKLALAGKARLVYDINELHEIQKQIFGSTHYYGCGWYYPPIFLLMVLPLSLLSYLYSFVAWIGVTLFLFIIILYRISPRPICLPLMIAFPGIFENFIFGQNGYLSGILLGGGLLLLARSPFLAGILFGLLSYKPHFIALVLFALVIGRYWKALIGTMVAFAVISSASMMVFGFKIWLDYFKVMGIPMELLEMGAAGWSIMPTFFAATLSAGFNVKTAYAVQGIVIVAVLIGITRTWLKHYNINLRGSILVLGVLLFTPYAFVYDLAVLALPLCWLWEEGRVNGRLPGELIILLLAWVMPICVGLLWNEINIFSGKLQIGPVIILALFSLALLKARFDKAQINY